MHLPQNFSSVSFLSSVVLSSSIFPHFLPKKTFPSHKLSLCSCNIINFLYLELLQFLRREFFCRFSHLYYRDISNVLRVWRLGPSNTSATRDPSRLFFRPLLQIPAASYSDCGSFASLWAHRRYPLPTYLSFILRPCICNFPKACQLQQKLPSRVSVVKYVLCATKAFPTVPQLPRFLLPFFRRSLVIAY